MCNRDDWTRVALFIGGLGCRVAANSFLGWRMINDRHVTLAEGDRQAQDDFGKTKRPAAVSQVQRPGRRLAAMPADHYPRA